jgi:hypothetical protein
MTFMETQPQVDLPVRSKDLLAQNMHSWDIC